MNNFSEEELSKFLYPACRNGAKIRCDFEEKGFTAGIPAIEFYEATASSEDEKSRIRSLVSKVCTQDIVRPLRRKVPRPGGSKSAEELSDICQSNWHDYPELVEEYQREKWARFAVEANSLDAPEVDKQQRDKSLKIITRQSVEAHFPDAKQFPLTKLKKWHVNGAWVDVAFGIKTIAAFEFVVSFKTHRPRRLKPYNVLTEFEPNQNNGYFDQTQVEFWAIPSGGWKDDSYVCFGIGHSEVIELGPAYWRFYSARGLKRISDAHLTLIQLTLDECCSNEK